MGDRSNIAIEDRDGNRIYLNGHYMGPSAIGHAAHGLKSGRLGHATYLTRIIFSNMIRDDIDDETGYGIGPSLTNNEYPVIVIDGDSPTGEVWLEDWDGETSLTAKVPATIFVKLAEGRDYYGDFGYDELIEALGAPTE